MAMPQTITATRHPYANGEFKRMLIDGEWVKAASGKTFESRNPATGELLATVAEGDAEDIDRAVAAARRAFEGPWSKMKPYRAAAAPAEARRPRREAFRRAQHARHARHGRADQPYSRNPPARARHAALVCRDGGIDTRRDDRELAARRVLLLHAEGAGRRRRRDHSRGTGRWAPRSGRSARRSPPAAPSC